MSYINSIPILKYAYELYGQKAYLTYLKCDRKGDFTKFANLINHKKNINETYILTKQQIKILSEGGILTKNNDGNFNFTINNSREDKDNEFLDTRFFRTPNDILYKGDKERHLTKKISNYEFIINTCDILLNAINNNRINNLSDYEKSQLDKVTYDSTMRHLTQNGPEYAIPYLSKRKKSNGN